MNKISIETQLLEQEGCFYRLLIIFVKMFARLDFYETSRTSACNNIIRCLLFMDLILFDKFVDQIHNYLWSCTYIRSKYF